MSHDHEVGDVIGERYRVVRTVGRGGAATTYAAEDRETGTHVAVKHLRLWQQEGWKSLELFEREAKVMAGLSHPNVPRFIESLKTESEQGAAFYLVRELIEGESLQELIDRGERLDELQVKDVARRLLVILRDLHALNPAVIHRDIKPSNVLRRQDGELFIVDFGAVRRPDPGDGSTVVGTYGYMAPEQFRGHAVPASDVYGLGATLLFLLTHKAPADLPQDGLRVDFGDAVNVTPPLRAWLTRALEPDPAHRFATAAQALTALDAPAVATDLTRTTKPRSKRPLILLGALALVAAAGAGAVVYLERERPTEQAALPKAPEPPVIDRGRYVQPIWTLTEQQTMVADVAFAQNGAQIIGGSSDGTIRLWRLNDGKVEHTFKGPRGHLGALQLSPDEQWLAASAGRSVTLFDFKSREHVAKLEGHTKRILGLAFSPNGELVASGGEDGLVKLWNVKERTLVRTFEPGTGRIHAVVFHPSGDTLFAAGDKGTIIGWKVDSGKPAFSLKGHKAGVSDIRFGNDAETLVSSGDDKTARLWHLRYGREIRVLESDVDEVWAVAVSPDGSTMLSAGKSDTIWTWSMDNGSVLDKRDARLGGVIDLQISKDGKYFAAAGLNAHIKVWFMDGAIWRPKLPPEDYVPVTESRPEPKTEEERLVRQAEDLLYRIGSEKTALSKASALLDEAAKLNPNYPLLFVQRARLAHKSGYISHDKFEPGSLELARSEVDKAIALDPQLPEAYIAKAYIEAFQKNYAAARQMAEQAAKLAPDNALAHLAVLSVAETEDRVDDALAAGRRVFELTKDATILGNACGTLEDVYSHLRDYDGAEKMFIAQIRYNPDSAWTRGNYAQFLNNRERYEEAVAMAKQALERMNYGAARKTLGEAYAGWSKSFAAKEKDMDRAKELLDLADDAWPHPSADIEVAKGFYYYELGIVEGDLSHVDTAKSHLQKALSLEPEHSHGKRLLNSSQWWINEIQKSRKN